MRCGNNHYTTGETVKQFVLSMAVLVAFAVNACSDDDAAATPVVKPLIGLTGALSNPNNISIPPTVKLVAIWNVYEGSPDYIYAFGFGTLSSDRKSYSFSLNDVPPEIALNGEGVDPASPEFFRLGVAYLVLLDDPMNKIPSNMMLSSEGPPEGTQVYGAVDNTGIMYVRTNGDVDDKQWALQFPQGYSIGVGVRVEDGLDKFVPTNETSRPLLIDTSRNLEAFTFPNWQ